MKKSGRRVLFWGAVLFCAVLVLGLVSLRMIDRLARAAIERGGTYALGVPTTLGSANVALRTKHFWMRELRVANPEGFSPDGFLRLRQGGVSLNPSSLTKEVIELPTLELNDLELSLERRGGKTNYGVILDNLARFESGEKPAAKEGGKKFVIREIDLRNIRVRVDFLPEAGELTKIVVPIDRIQLHDIGTGGKSVPMGELVGILVKAVIAAAIEKGGKVIPGDILGELQSQLGRLEGLGDLGLEITGEVQEQLEKVIEGAQGTLDEVGTRAREAAEKAAKGLQDLIPGKK